MHANFFVARPSIAAMRRTLLVFAALVAAALPLRAADDADGHPAIAISRASSGITLDGDLSDPAWKSATRVEKWWETNPGDNVEPKAKSVGYLMYANKIPRGGNCFICNENTLTGLKGLPPAGHITVAPYVTAKAVGEPRDGAGTPFVNRPVGTNAGADLKWTPTPDSVVDTT